MVLTCARAPEPQGFRKPYQAVDKGADRAAAGKAWQEPQAWGWAK